MAGVAHKLINQLTLHTPHSVLSVSIFFLLVNDFIQLLCMISFVISLLPWLCQGSPPVSCMC